MRERLSVEKRRSFEAVDQVDVVANPVCLGEFDPAFIPAYAKRSRQTTLAVDVRASGRGPL